MIFFIVSLGVVLWGALVMAGIYLLLFGPCYYLAKLIVIFIERIQEHGSKDRARES